MEYFPRVATRTRSRLSMETAVEKAKEMRRRGKDIRHRQGKMWRLWRGVKIGGFHGISRSTSVNIPDSIKIAILHNETQGALQQHLQLTASITRDYNPVREIIIECYRATASF